MSVEANLEKPKTVETDGLKTEQHSLKDQIAAEKWLAQKNAASASSGTPRFPLVMFRTKAGGPVN